MSSLIQTVSGAAWDLENPDHGSILWSDISWSLSHLCRFNGHCNPFYSVAEHSIRVANLMHPHWQIYGLLHDAHEAWLGDVTTPLKKLLGDNYHRLAQDIDRAIYKAAGIPWPTPEITGAVRRCDQIMLVTEKRDLLEDSFVWSGVDNIEPDPIHIRHMEMAHARRLWLHNFRWALDAYKKAYKSKITPSLAVECYVEV